MNWVKIVDKFSKQTIGVIGDLMADHYIIGDVERISPEAPTPIVLVKQEKITLGGAGNTAANIAALGGNVDMVSVVGRDFMGKTLLKQLRAKNISTRGIMEHGRWPTVQKTRLIARGQQIARLDKENTAYIDKNFEKKVIRFIGENIKNWRGIVISDYAKGFITENLARCIVRLARQHSVPLIVDAKPRHLRFFKGATVFTPNRKEAGEFIGKDIKSKKDMRAAGKILQKKLDAAILITRGSEGAILFGKNKIIYLPSKAREVFDVTGAGDTLAAVLALSLSSGAHFRHAAEISNAAAGIVVGKSGTATVSLTELKKVLFRHH